MTSETAFVGVDEIDEGPDVIAVGDAGLLFAPLESFLAGGVVGGRVPEHGVAVGGFVLGGLADVLADPIADLTVGDGLLDDVEHLVVGHAGVLEPESVESLAEVSLVVGVEEAGEVQPDLVDVSREMHPAVHGLAGAAGVEDGAHRGEYSVVSGVCQPTRRGGNGSSTHGTAATLRTRWPEKEAAGRSSRPLVWRDPSSRSESVYGSATR